MHCMLKVFVSGSWRVHRVHMIRMVPPPPQRKEKPCLKKEKKKKKERKSATKISIIYRPPWFLNIGIGIGQRKTHIGRPLISGSNLIFWSYGNTFHYFCFLCAQKVSLRTFQLHCGLRSSLKNERRSYGFGTTWGRVINDRICIFEWTISLKGSGIQFYHVCLFSLWTI